MPALLSSQFPPKSFPNLQLLPWRYPSRCAHAAAVHSGWPRGAPTGRLQPRPSSNLKMSQNQSSTHHSVEIDSPSTQIPVETNGAEAVPPEDVQEVAKARRHTRKRKSPLWNFFEEVDVPSTKKKKRGEIESKVKCKACGSLLSKNKSGTTSHWGRHLEQCESFKCQQKSKIQTTINFPSNEDDVEGDLPVLSTPGFYDSAKIRELICKMIIVHKLPFCIVEYTWFNILLKALNSAYKKVSRVTTIRNDCMRLYESEKELLKKYFKNIKRISLTCGLLHNRCCAQILNLIVQDGLEIIDPLIDKVRKTIKYIKKSNTRSYKFNADIDSLNLDRRKKLVLDVCTRWGSTYKMLDSAFHYRAAIDVYAAGDANYRWQPTEEEWRLYEKISGVLGVLHSATEEFSGSKYPTSNLFYPHIVNVKKVLNELKQSKETLLKKMADAMLDKFDKYWSLECNTLFAIATILDPRFKMDMIQFTFPSLYSDMDLSGKLAHVESTLHELYGTYESEHNKSMSSLKSNESNSECSSTSGSANSVFSSASEFQQFVKAHAAHPSKPDLRKYLEDPLEVIANENFDILQWWKLNESKYPIVAKMAKDVLTIPISTVSSESSFSAGGRVVDDYRSSLLPSTVQALVCASSWIRGGNHKLQDLEDDANSISIPLKSNEHPSAISIVGSN